GRRLWGRAGIAVLGGLLVGDAPQLIHDLAVGYPESSVYTYLQRTLTGVGSPPLADRLRGGMLVGVPLRMGLCEPNVCGGPARLWGVLIPLLLVIAGLTASAALVSRARDTSAA